MTIIPIEFNEHQPTYKGKLMKNAKLKKNSFNQWNITI